MGRRGREEKAPSLRSNRPQSNPGSRQAAMAHASLALQSDTRSKANSAAAKIRSSALISKKFSVRFPAAHPLRTAGSCGRHSTTSPPSRGGGLSTAKGGPTDRERTTIDLACSGAPTAGGTPCKLLLTIAGCGPPHRKAPRRFQRGVWRVRSDTVARLPLGIMPRGRRLSP